MMVAHVLPGDAVYLPMGCFFLEKALNAHSINIKVPIQIFDNESKQAFLQMHEKVPHKPTIAALKLLLDRTQLVDPDGLHEPGPAQEPSHVKIEKEKDDDGNGGGGVGVGGVDTNSIGAHTVADAAGDATLTPLAVPHDANAPPPPGILVDFASGKRSLWECDKNEVTSLLKVCKGYKFDKFVAYMLANYADLDEEGLRQTWNADAADSEEPEKDIQLYLAFLKEELQLDPSKKRPHDGHASGAPEAKAAKTKTCKTEQESGKSREPPVPTQPVQVQSDGKGNDVTKDDIPMPIAPSCGAGQSDERTTPKAPEEEEIRAEQQQQEPQVAGQCTTTTSAAAEENEIQTQERQDVVQSTPPIANEENKIQEQQEQVGGQCTTTTPAAAEEKEIHAQHQQPMPIAPKENKIQEQEQQEPHALGQCTTPIAPKENKIQEQQQQVGGQCTTTTPAAAEEREIQAQHQQPMPIAPKENKIQEQQQQVGGQCATTTPAAAEEKEIQEQQQQKEPQAADGETEALDPTTKAESMSKLGDEETKEAPPPPPPAPLTFGFWLKFSACLGLRWPDVRCLLSLVWCIIDYIVDLIMIILLYYLIFKFSNWVFRVGVPQKALYFDAILCDATCCIMHHTVTVSVSWVSSTTSTDIKTRWTGQAWTMD